MDIGYITIACVFMFLVGLAVGTWGNRRSVETKENASLIEDKGKVIGTAGKETTRNISSTLGQRLLDKFYKEGQGAYYVDVGDIIHVAASSAKELLFTRYDTSASIKLVMENEKLVMRFILGGHTLSDRELDDDTIQSLLDSVKINIPEPLKYLIELRQLVYGVLLGFNIRDKDLNAINALLNEYLLPMQMELKKAEDFLVSDYVARNGKVDKRRLRKEEPIKPFCSALGNWTNSHKFGFYLMRPRLENSRFIDCVVFTPEGVEESSSLEFISKRQFMVLEDAVLFTTGLNLNRYREDAINGKTNN